MLEFKDKCVIGIDLAVSSKNPTGWAMLKNKTVKPQLLHTNKENIENTLQNHPELVAIDAPKSSKKRRVFQKNRQRNDKKRLQSASQKLRHEKLTLRAIRLNRLIEEKTYKAIEVHPTST